jgi:hypothetical protein
MITFDYHAWLQSLSCRAIVTSFFTVGLILISFGCAPTEFTTLTLYDTPDAFVRLETDPAVEQGRGHSHPATITADQVAAVLHGILVEEPITRAPFYDDMSQPRRHRAFDGQTITLFTPLLVVALGKATSEEIVTFYQSKRLSGTSREVTSGGLFVREDGLHIIFGNYRSHTHYMADPGVVDTADDRLTPLRALAPQQGRLAFDPPTALRTASSSLWSKFLQQEKRELIILFNNLTPLPLSTFSSADAPVR